MIFVQRKKDESSQKTVSVFLKRAKKSNVVARSRKTQFRTKKLSDLEKKRKAMRIADYAEKKIVLDKISKNL
jgi:hypothetical protein